MSINVCCKYFISIRHTNYLFVRYFVSADVVMSKQHERRHRRHHRRHHHHHPDHHHHSDHNRRHVNCRKKLMCWGETHDVIDYDVDAIAWTVSINVSDANAVMERNIDHPLDVQVLIANGILVYVIIIFISIFIFIMIMIKIVIIVVVVVVIIITIILFGSSQSIILVL